MYTQESVRWESMCSSGPSSDPSQSSSTVKSQFILQSAGQPKLPSEEIRSSATLSLDLPSPSSADTSFRAKHSCLSSTTLRTGAVYSAESPSHNSYASFHGNSPYTREVFRDQLKRKASALLSDGPEADVDPVLVTVSCSERAGEAGSLDGEGATAITCTSIGIPQDTTASSTMFATRQPSDHPVAISSTPVLAHGTTATICCGSELEGPTASSGYSKRRPQTSESYFGGARIFRAGMSCRKSLLFPLATQVLPVTGNVLRLN